MSCEEKSVVLELLTLKKPTALDELINKVAKPKGAIPNFGLPRWKTMPLESKIPMIPGPEGSYHFTRNKLGKKLWISSADAEFNLSDPYNYDAEWTYEPLHDEHLARYFSQPTNLRRMIKLGLVTKELDAKCSVKEYNIYRKYLKKLYNDSIKLKIKQKTLMDSEKRALDLAEKLAEKDIEKLLVQEKKLEATNRLLEQKRQEEGSKLQRQKDKQLKMDQQLKDIEAARVEANKLKIQRAWEQAQILRQKREAAAYIERQKKVKTIRQWRDSEYQRKIFKAKRELQEKKEKRNSIEKKWQLRQEMQERQVEREQFLLQCSHEKRIMNIKAYNAKIDEERTRMQQLIEECKMFNKCYRNRHVPVQRNGTCCIQPTPKQKHHKSDPRNSCSAKSYPIHKGRRAKSILKTKKHKKVKQKPKKPKVELMPEPEPVDTRQLTETTLFTKQLPTIEDNCKCAEVKAEWL
ncbi:calponin homology domain-containing protein DDB_G0272472 [Athalia rosae]|uniref:calponin homology domain-containing protein DDB_G0272472 n=1 Tax=Athalia rosae TaxID=37344 RepID=UPI002033A7F0|nr:calponin homology domain-containing protein DDB_G0272472 [Athalia rosae]